MAKKIKPTVLMLDRMTPELANCLLQLMTSRKNVFANKGNYFEFQTNLDTFIADAENVCDAVEKMRVQTKIRK